jgi:hypothetical protein
MRISKNFISQEFLSKSFHDYLTNRGLNPMGWIDRDIVAFCEWLKIKCNGANIIINDWYWGGKYQYSGFREHDDIGAELSQHKYKCAVDIKVDSYTPKQIRQIIVDNFTYINKVFGITTIEKIEFTPTWNHIDKRWTGLNYLNEVRG